MHITDTEKDYKMHTQSMVFNLLTEDISKAKNT